VLQLLVSTLKRPFERANEHTLSTLFARVLTTEALGAAQVAALQEDAAAQERQVAALARRDPRDLWAADLDAFLAALDAEEATEAGRREELVRQQKQSRGGGGGAKVSLCIVGCVGPQ